MHVNHVDNGPSWVVSIMVKGVDNVDKHFLDQNLKYLNQLNLGTILKKIIFAKCLSLMLAGKC